MGKLTNWDRLKNMTPKQTLTNRDVYEDQQLERSAFRLKKSMTTRKIADIAMSIFFFFLFWCIYSFGQYGSYLTHGGTVSGDFLSLIGGYGYFFRPTFLKLLFDIAFTVVFYKIMYIVLEHNLKGQNQLSDFSDVNQHPNDQHIALPEEVQRKFDWFPDVGATSNVQFSSMISHVALSNKGLKTIQVAKRAETDIVDESGEVVTYKGEVLYDDDGNVLYETKSLIDVDFMKALFDASGLPNARDEDGRKMRKFYNAGLIPYNPDGSDREKLGKFNTVADLINKDWEFPYYEPQRPGGAYLVDTAPVNTMV